jgi:hypothetical protein
MPFLVKSRRASVEKLLAQHAGASVVDVTSRGPEPWVRFSPFYPHGDIPVPFSPGRTAMSVEGIWQGLKVFEKADMDPATLQITTMKGIKRTVRTFGRVLGHRAGLAEARLVPYAEARREIYLPTYRWVLEHKLAAEVAALRKLGEGGRTVLLLDYETNCDIEDLSRPLSHAGLIAEIVGGA